MQQELNFLKYWEVLKKRLLVIILVPLLAGLGSGIISYYYLDPVYEASTTLIVGKKASENGHQQEVLEYSVLLANRQLVKTYVAIAKSRTVMENVLEELNLPLTIKDFNKKVSVDSVKDTEILEIKVEDKDPVLAAKIANSLSASFSSKIIEIKKVDSVSTIDKAVIPNNPIRPNEIMNIFVASSLGLIISIGLILIREYLDDTIKTRRDAEKSLNLPVLGEIPHYKIDGK